LEVKLSEHATEPGRYCDTYRKLQDWLVGILAQGALPLKDRAEAGRVLGALGDPRADVVCAIPALVDVPAGEFKMGEGKEQHRVKLNAYRIGKYPVTNAQFRCFVKSGGYTDAHRDCWTDEGWQTRARQNWDKPNLMDDLNFGIANHPVVTVSWYEAVAYCNWLNKTNPGRKFHLPTEAEWERAARHTDGREYPWGKEFDQEKANTDGSGIGQTTAVGLFPRGVSVCDAFDLAGNVWEWCSSQPVKYPYRADDGREDMIGSGGRCLRGGAWLSYVVGARCASRDRSLADGRVSNVGFRLAESVTP
jgi:formylglycine-generating enzyme required for sulfatase activity